LALISARRYIFDALVDRAPIPTTRLAPLKDSGLTRACSA
jgi:hypothetical protein